MSQTSKADQLRRLQIRHPFYYSVGTFVSHAWLFNFLAFMLVSIHLGGDAVNGKFENGHYYLFGNTGKPSLAAGYTEVSSAVFDYSRFHAYSVIFMFVLCIAVAIWGHILNALEDST